MSRKNLIFISGFMLLGTTLSASESSKTTQKKKLTIQDYQKQEIHGWTVYIEKAAKKNPQYKKSVSLIEKQLATISKAINPEIIKKLKKVPIWLNDTKGTRAGYHPGAKWLRDNGRVVEKAKSIELGSVKSYVQASIFQPMIILHELAHAFHHYEYKFKHPEITKAFNIVVASKSYENVSHIKGKKGRHYALNNEKEYFAECTEAYFGKNDFYPFTKSDLKKHDPNGYAMIEAIWEVKTKK